jgi:hypothetical protein
MPKTKNILHRFGGGVVEEETIYTTHWVQMVGETMVRCDDDAKERGWGVWTTRAPTRSAAWSGGPGLVGEGYNPVNWIRDDHTESFISEVDYS